MRRRLTQKTPGRLRDVRNRERFNIRAAEMKEKYSMPEKRKQALDAEQAFRLGYTAAISGLIGSRDLCPYSDPFVRKHWKRGYDLGGKGLKITLPKMAHA
jgi:ribosome modulation factor